MYIFLGVHYEVNKSTLYGNHVLLSVRLWYNVSN